MFQKYSLKPLLLSLHFKRFSTSKKNFYDVLGLGRNSTQEQIKKEFHKLAKLHHPDSSESSGDQEKFKQISEAYNVIGDVEKRAKYDSDLNLQLQNEERQKQQSQSYYQPNYQSRYSNNSDSYFQQRYRYQEEFNQARMRKKQRDEAEEEEIRRAYEVYANQQTWQPDLQFYIVCGVFAMLILRWMYLVVYPEKRRTQQISPLDDDFEYAQIRGRIALRPEDISGFSLKQLNEIDSTGKYVLPPKAKQSVEEFKSLQKLIKGKPKEIKNEEQKQQILQDQIWQNEDEEDSDIDLKETTWKPKKSKKYKTKKEKDSESLKKEQNNSKINQENSQEISNKGEEKDSLKSEDSNQKNNVHEKQIQIENIEEDRSNSNFYNDQKSVEQQQLQ